MKKKEFSLKNSEKTLSPVRWIIGILVTVLVIAAAVVAVCLLIKRQSATSPVEPVSTATSATATAAETAPTTSKPSVTEPLTSAATDATTTETTTRTTGKAATTTTRAAKAPTPTAAAPSVSTAGHYVQKNCTAWYLRLVNPWNPLPADYNYTANIKNFDSAGRQFDARAMDAFQKMLAAGKQYNLWGVSLYRPYDLQVKLFNKQVARVKSSGYKGDAEAKAATVVARPGTSEHHLGLAADILGSGFGDLEEEFDQTPAYRWLKEHCAEYGFILRYPKEKEDVTGVIYEPWHYRYVGVDVATEIMSRGITLEEYLEEKGL